MTMKTLFATVLVSVVGVAGCHAQQIDDHAQAQIESIHSDTASLMMDASCLDGSVLRPNCGLVTKRVAMQDFRDTFAVKKCADVTTEVCQERFDRAVSAWMVQRYTLADVGGVEVTCDANPGRCDDPKEHELLLLDSHNAAVRAMDARRENDVEARRHMEHAIDNAQSADTALLGIVVAGAVLAPRHHHHYRW